MIKTMIKKNHIYLLLVAVLTACGMERPPMMEPSSDTPDIFPDYVGVTIPAQIAPMNFNVGDEDADCVYVKVTGGKGGEIETSGKWADFDEEQWHQLTARNAGADLTFDVSVKDRNGKWRRYAPFTMHVSDIPLEDYGVVYRKIAPGYQTFSKTGIYQRELASFEESAVLEETAVGGQCINCHYSKRGSADRFTIHVRGKNGGTIVKNGADLSSLHSKSAKTNCNPTYGYWHPEGKYVAFSFNKIVQNFYLDNAHNIEPWDVYSDIAVLDMNSNQFITSPLLETGNCETTPAFSPDGKTLYFCYADSVDMPGEYDRLRYSLCSIGFDASKGALGDSIRVVVPADTTGVSVSLPRPSYDGRYVMYNVTEYGTSPIHHADADLWILDLASGSARALDEVNSDSSDAYHNWSSGGQGWFLFNSKRIDGMYANIYLSLMGKDGKATKPFLMPQKNPLKYYTEALHSFNAPDFTADKIELDPSGVGSLLAE